MKILIIGFQRSGTTLLRRIFGAHPGVRQILHEEFLLTRFKTLPEIKKYLVTRKTKMNKQTWGDKTPYYPNIRKMPVSRYCGMWNDLFGKEARIIHVVRHPYDVAFSVHKKYSKQTFHKAITLYRKSIINSVKATLSMPTAITFKYEDLVLNPDKMVPELFEFCNLDSSVDFRALMKNWENPKYRSFDESRVFAHKGEKIPKLKEPLDNIITEINELIGDPKYEY